MIAALLQLVGKDPADLTLSVGVSCANASPVSACGQNTILVDCNGDNFNNLLVLECSTDVQTNQNGMDSGGAGGHRGGAVSATD